MDVGLSFSIAQQAQKQPGLLVVIVPDPIWAEQLIRELPFFLKTETIPILHFPDWETLPFDRFSPHQDIISERLTVLYRLSQLKKAIVVISVSTALHRLCPRAYLAQHAFLVKEKDQLNLTTLRSTLEQSGYTAVPQVMEHGEFSVRGSIIDLFPMGYAHPIRVDLFEDEIESLRLFDPQTQCSIEKISTIELLPAKEFPTDETTIRHFRTQWRNHFSGDPRQSPIYTAVTENHFPSGIEYYLPLFFEQTEDFFDHLPRSAALIPVGDLTSAARQFLEEVRQRHEQFSCDLENPILPIGSLFLKEAVFFQKSKSFSNVPLGSNQTGDQKTKPLPNLNIESKAKNPLSAVETFLKQTSDRVLFCAETSGRQEVIKTLFEKHDLHLVPVDNWSDFLNASDQAMITIAPIEKGSAFSALKITLISEFELFGRRVMQRRRRQSKKFDQGTVLRHLSELSIGDRVVHIQHGVGRYLGLSQLPSQPTEFVLLEYADQNKLYVPVSALNLIHRYTSVDPEQAPLHKLGSGQWDKAKTKALKRIRDTAAELLEIYAHRAAKKGVALSYPEEAFLNFTSAFPFEETPDQQQAIDAVVIDLLSEKPMDRVVCGDVGFGKTEVAIRAAFIAAFSGKQTALLVPTTLLAQQHYQTFLDRFANYPIQIEVLSRFKTAKEQLAILKKVKAGQIDILIGTHKLLSQGVAFKDLGLLIIDEEHRFGVRQKEVIKKIRSDLNVLTLTATPIPRTLNMAMSGIRDLSIIATAPEKRLSVKTFLREYQTALVQEAILRELRRGGQVYYLFNQVNMIAYQAQSLQKLVPNAKIAIAHGQMAERELEQVMLDFYHRRFNVLVCTTIIETGIDVPTANTIIIDRADKFGLAQLHQLRGRVGRSHHQAYAFLLTPPVKQITKDAQKRLEAISQLSTLGVGFMLATQDLEIRGAGELLGDNQSGEIQSIGFSMYMKLLERAVKALKRGEALGDNIGFETDCEVDLQVSALIPSDYLANVQMRLILYKRLASASTHEQLDKLHLEMADRFGLLPQNCVHLIRLSKLKLTCRLIGIARIKITSQGGYVKFVEKPQVSAEKIMALIQNQPDQYQLMGSDGIRFKVSFKDEEARFQFVEHFIADIQQGAHLDEKK